MGYTVAMDSQLLLAIISVLCFVPALVFHEMAHGFAAWCLGDPTARMQGRLSINPLKHIDPFGTVLLPGILILAGGPVFGYAKPVPYNPSNLKNPKIGDVIVSLAGPCANLLLALLAAGVAWALFPNVQFYQEGFMYYFYVYYLPSFTLINLYLMFFNLIPVPPLDGSSIFALFVPKKYMHRYYQIQHYSFPILMVVLVALPYVFHVNPVGVYLDFTAEAVAKLIFPYYLIY